MALVPMRLLVDEAAKGNYALGAYNVNNMEQIQAIMAAAQETKSPVIIPLGTLPMFAAMLTAFRNTSGPVTALAILSTTPPFVSLATCSVYIRKSLPLQPPLAQASKDGCWSMTSVPMPTCIVKGIFFR